MECTRCWTTGLRGNFIRTWVPGIGGQEGTLEDKGLLLSAPNTEARVRSPWLFCTLENHSLKGIPHLPLTLNTSLWFSVAAIFPSSVPLTMLFPLPRALITASVYSYPVQQTVISAFGGWRQKSWESSIIFGYTMSSRQAWDRRWGAARIVESGE